ncbi:MAG TPA: hypothetical protein VGS58_02995, partial [Candidatus Sulfopaludibacter sp.]|nr:hypothetical protein [Candidatus Sulfopaludibacter sp.]
MKVALGRRITTGILNGFEAWMSYGIMEYICGMIVPVLLHRNGVMMTAQWRGMVFLLGTYAIIGMLLGALSAFVIPGYDYLERRSRKLLVLSVVVTFSVFCIQPFNAGAIAWIPAVLLIVYAVLRDIGGTSERLGVAGKPWVVYTVLILSSTCAHRTSSVFMILLAFALAVAAGVFAVYLALQRLLEMVAPRWATAPALRHAFTLTLVLGLSFGPNLRAAWMTAGDPDVRPSGAA